MKQQEYLSKLRTKLLSALDAKEAEEIAADYGEYFQSALSDGKTEEEISRELGGPENLAASIIRETKGEPGNYSFASLRMRSLKALAAIWLIADVLILLLSTRIYGGMLALSFIAMVSAPPLAFYVFDGMKYFRGNRHVGRYNLLLCLCGIPVAIGLIYYFMVGGNAYIRGYFNPSRIGPIFNANMFALRSFFLGLACLAFIYGLKQKTEFISLSYAALGLVMFNSYIIYITNNLDDPNMLFISLLKPFFWIVFGVTLMLASMKILRCLLRKDKELL